MLQRISLLGLSVVFACAPASPTDGASSPPSPASSSSTLPSAANTSTPDATSHASTRANPEPPVSFVLPGPMTAPSTVVAPAPGPISADAPPFESGLDEVLDARPIRLTKRSPEVIKPEAERLAASAKALAPRAKGKGKAHASAAVAYDELAYALRRELAKAPATTELAADLRARRKAAEDTALEQYFEAIAEDNTLDDAKYRSAHLLHARRDIVGARKQYFILVENHPKSAFVPLAYLGFALLYADDASQDKTKWPFAEMSAEKALEPKGNPATPEALFLIARAQRGGRDTSEFAETLAKLRKEFPKSAAAKRKF